MKGRKRHLLVDTIGLIVGVLVHEANIQDHDGGKEIVEHPWSGLRGVWAPKDAVIDWEKIRPRGFHVLKWRSLVERTFAWLSTWRRLAKDYEVLPSSEEAWIYLAMMRIMLRRLAQNSS